MADKIVLLDSGKIVQVGSPKELYEHPNSIFTALFIGSPSMSLVEGVVNIENDSAYIVTESNEKFPIKKKSSLKINQKVVLGIRPNNFYISNAKDGYLVSIDMMEYTGAEDRIYGKIANCNINVVLSAGNFKNDEDLYISYDVDKTNIFDKETSKAINN